MDSNSIDPPNSPAGESPCATATTAASGRNREELLEPQPGQYHPKVAERAFASRYLSYPPYISRRQTISKPLARALFRLY